MPYLEFIINRPSKGRIRVIIWYLIDVIKQNTVFVKSKPNTKDANEIRNELNNDNYHDWNTSDSSLDNDDDANEIFDEQKELVDTTKSSRQGLTVVKKGTCLWNIFIKAH